ncbi:MAG: 4Fe-4S dicluster domain-containing protein [Muribaculaceae bacterium]|nr:4Fe-4S dicluster domain-containing protein [Muribaculaceae bacterium]
MLRKIRIVTATVIMVLITALLLDFTGTLHHWLGWLAKVQFLPALLACNVVIVCALLLLTMIMGRIYCSVICPLGIMQDVISWFAGKHRKNRFTYSGEKRVLRLVMLGMMVVALIAGAHVIVALLAPYSSYGRIVNSLLQPLYMWGNNLLASIAAHYESYAFYGVDVWMKSVTVTAVAAITLVALGILAWRNGRTYCNTICPVGTVLGYVAKFSLLKVRFDADKCKSCSLCSKNCKASCIDYKSHTMDYSRCVTCGDCVEKCNFGALRYRLARKSDGKKAAKAESAHDEVRRAVLVGGAIVAAGAVTAQVNKKVDGGLAAIADKKEPSRSTPLTPPGSLGAHNMATHCTACQLCVAQCPNGVLRPSKDLKTLMQPTMNYDRGFCRPECTRCSEVCPTGAIREIDQSEKSSLQIGHAVWVKDNCLPAWNGTSCGNCARHCPSGAIMMVPLDENDENSPMVPVVNVERCTGCGSCEYVCPSRPFSAIYVEGHEQHRSI